MKRLAFVAVVAVVAASFALPAFAGEPIARSGKAIKAGRAPKLDVALQMMNQPPAAFGIEKEQPVPQFPAFLNDREPVVTERPETMRGFTQGMSPSVKNSFGGYDSQDNADLFGFRVMPPDTEGDVGNEHYVQWNNLGWKYWDKDTKTENGPFPGNSFHVGTGGACETSNDGDPVVLYDHYAGRWVFTQFDIGPGLACFAVSDGEDPTGPYTTYEFPISLAGFNDYPKMGIFVNEDGSQSAYHMTTNEFNGGFIGVNLTAFDRDAILAADPAAGFEQFTIPPATGSDPFAFSLQPPHLDGGSDAAPAGDCGNYVMVFDDETWGDGSGPDGYRMWEFCHGADFTGGSLTEKPFVLSNFEFDAELCNFSRSCIPQPAPGSALDTLGQFSMFRFSQYMIDGSLEGVVSHTVDVGGNLAGSAWAEFGLGDDKVLLDQGVVDAALDDGINRWMPSVAQNKDGDILIGYTRSSAATFPSVYHSARRAGDAPGTMKQENACIDGTGVQTGGSRWGDYSTVSVDPSDGCTFWYTQEYVETTGSFFWDTQVCVAAFEGCQDVDPCDGIELAGPTKVGVGEDFDLEISCANAESLVRVAAGRAEGSSVRDVPGCGPVEFDIAPRANNFGSTIADADGNATSGQNLGSNFGNNTIYYQVLDQSKCEVSNVLAIDVNPADN